MLILWPAILNPHVSSCLLCFKHLRPLVLTLDESLFIRGRLSFRFFPGFVRQSGAGNRRTYRGRSRSYSRSGRISSKGQFSINSYLYFRLSSLISFFFARLKSAYLYIHWRVECMNPILSFISKWLYAIYWAAQSYSKRILTKPIYFLLINRRGTWTLCSAIVCTKSMAWRVTPSFSVSATLFSFPPAPRIKFSISTLALKPRKILCRRNTSVIASVSLKNSGICRKRIPITRTNFK